MSRNKHLFTNVLGAAAILGLSAYGIAYADDSSMSMWTGDSYAFFNNLDASPGHFNVARAPRATDDVAVNAKDKDAAKAGTFDARGGLFARRPSHGMRTNPFGNDTGA